MGVAYGCGLETIWTRNKVNGPLGRMALADCRDLALKVPWKVCLDGGMPSSQGRWTV